MREARQSVATTTARAVNNSPESSLSSKPPWLCRSTDTTRTRSSSGTSYCRNHSPYAPKVSTGTMSSSVTSRRMPAASQ